MKNNEHRLWLIRRFFPGFLDRVIKRLQAADSINPDLEEQLHAEDEIMKVLINSANRFIYLNTQIDKKDTALAEKAKELNKKEKALCEKNKARERIVECSST